MMPDGGAPVLVFDDDGFRRAGRASGTRFSSYVSHAGGDVAVHISWHDRGYRHAATFSKSHAVEDMLDWFKVHRPGGYILHREGAVMFRDVDVAVMFGLTFG